MSTQWFYRLFDEEFGPVPTATLEDLFAKGTLGHTDEVRAEGTSTWQSLDRALEDAKSHAPATTAVAAEDAESADDEMNWFYQFMGDEMGPVSFNELLEFATIGQLTADDQIKYGENGKWRRLGAIGRLVAVLPYQEAPPAAAAPSVANHTQAAEAVSVPSPAPVTSQAPKYAPAADEKSWFAWIRGVEYGPSSLLELNQSVQSGQIGPTDFVKYGPTGQWMPPAAVGQALFQFLLPDPVVAVPAKPAPPPPAPPEPKPSASIAAQPGPSAPQPSAEPAKTDPAPKPTPTIEPAAKAVPIQPPNAAPPEPRPAPSSASSGRSSPPPWQAPAKPAFKPPAKKKSSASSGGGLNLGGLFEDKKSLGVVGGVAGVALLIVLWMFLPASKGADIERVKQLEELLVQFRKTRAEKGDWQKFTEEAEKITKPIIADLKDVADRTKPAKQNLLWAAKDALPRMLTTAKTKEGDAAEIEFESYIFEAQRILGVGNPPPRAAPEEEDVGEGDGKPVNE